MRRALATYVSVFAAISITHVCSIGSAQAAAQPSSCPRTDALGVGRTVEIDTTGGPGFGMEHYKANDFLQSKEVVLTFDDGPQKYSTEMVLTALAEQCTKATFFSIGKMALGYPEIIREVVKAGHTVGTHTWSHKPIRKLKTFEEGRDAAANALKLEPQKPEGHFWFGANLGARCCGSRHQEAGLD